MHPRSAAALGSPVTCSPLMLLPPMNSGSPNTMRCGLAALLSICVCLCPTNAAVFFSAPQLDPGGPNTMRWWSEPELKELCDTVVRKESARLTLILRRNVVLTELELKQVCDTVVKQSSICYSLFRCSAVITLFQTRPFLLCPQGLVNFRRARSNRFILFAASKPHQV